MKTILLFLTLILIQTKILLADDLRFVLPYSQANQYLEQLILVSTTNTNIDFAILCFFDNTNTVVKVINNDILDKSKQYEAKVIYYNKSTNEFLIHFLDINSHVHCYSLQKRQNDAYLFKDDITNPGNTNGLYNEYFNSLANNKYIILNKKRNFTVNSIMIMDINNKIYYLTNDDQESYIIDINYLSQSCYFIIFSIEDKLLLTKFIKN